MSIYFYSFIYNIYTPLYLCLFVYTYVYAIRVRKSIIFIYLYMYVYLPIQMQCTEVLKPSIKVLKFFHNLFHRYVEFIILYKYIITYFVLIIALSG